MVLAGLGGMFILLVADWSDNAYLWLVFSALLMWVSAPAFLLVGVLPYGMLRSIATVGALALLIISAGFTGFLLVMALLLYPSGAYDSATVFRQHLAGLAAFAAGISLVVYLLSRRER